MVRKAHRGVADAGFAVEADTQRSLLTDGCQGGAETRDVGGISVWISVGILIEEDKGIRLVQRIHLFQAGGIGLKQGNSRVGEQRLHPAFLEQRQGHGGLVPEHGAELPVQQRPVFRHQGAGDGEGALRKGLLLYDGGEPVRRQGAVGGLCQDGGDNAEVAAVDLTEQHDRPPPYSASMRFKSS